MAHPSRNILARVARDQVEHVINDKLRPNQGFAWWVLGSKRPRAVDSGSTIILCAEGRILGAAQVMELVQDGDGWSVEWARKDAFVCEGLAYDDVPVRGWRYERADEDLEQRAREHAESEGDDDGGDVEDDLDDAFEDVTRAMLDANGGVW